jgi:hypothetical protein
MAERHEWEAIYSPALNYKRRKPATWPRPPARSEPKQVYDVEITLVPDDTPPAPRLPSRWQQIDDRISNFVLQVLLKVFKAAVLSVLLAILAAIIGVFTVFG